MSDLSLSQRLALKLNIPTLKENIMNTNTYTITLSNGKEIDYIRVDNCSNGNPRYVIHFLELITGKQIEDIKEEYEDQKANNRSINYSSLIDYEFKQALQNSRLIRGKKYRAKWFGGGIVISSYNLESDLEYLFDNI
jgi:hypothetical protein